jgi:hypothetical protein
MAVISKNHVEHVTALCRKKMLKIIQEMNKYKKAVARTFKLTTHMFSVEGLKSVWVNGRYTVLLSS